MRPISDCLHFLLGMVLSRLPENARILCVGVGTGSEILALAKDRPGWHFTGVDPSAEMLAVARRRLGEAGIAARCRLVEGYVDDVEDEGFDAVVSLFVAHFVAREDRPNFYRNICDRLADKGMFASAEISGDLGRNDYEAKLHDWTQVQSRMAGAGKSVDEIDGVLRRALTVLGPEQPETMWQEAGFDPPVSFYQAFMIRGWYATKNA